MRFATIMRLGAVIAVLAMSRHGAASNGWMEHRSCEVAAMWPCVGKGADWPLGPDSSLISKMLRKLAPVVAGNRHDGFNIEVRTVTEEAKERKRKRDRERYYRMKESPEWQAEREKRNARSREYAAEHRDEARERQRMWRAKNPDKCKAQRKRYYYGKAGVLARKRWMGEGGKELLAMSRFLRQERMNELYSVDASAYAEHRAKKREQYKKRHGQGYTERVSCRIPDWATKGQDVMDRRSVYIYQNLSVDEQASARGFSRERVMEHKKAGWHY